MVLFLPVLGMFCIWSIMNYLGTTPSLQLGLIFMSFVYFIYVINRYTDQKEDFTNDINKVLFFSQHKIMLYGGVAALTLSVLALSYSGRLYPFHFVLIGTGFLYSYKWIPWFHTRGGWRRIRLKDVPLMKNIFVSVLWGISVFLFPILFSQVQLQHPVLIGLLAGGLCLSTFSNTLFDDILDEVGDRLSGTATLPTLMGSRFSYTLILSLTLTWIASLAGLMYFTVLDPAHGLFLIGLAFYPAVYIIPHLRGWWSHVATDFLMELDLFYFASGLLLLTVL